MKKYSIYNQLKAYFCCLSLLATGSLLFSSCGSDKVEASQGEEDYWLHPYGASSADQSLQTTFFQKNGIYLLFNDTILRRR